jgi:hypothetical protein
MRLEKRCRGWGAQLFSFGQHVLESFELRLCGFEGLWDLENHLARREGFVTLSVFGSLYFSLFFAVWVSLFWFVSANNQTANLDIIHWALAKGFGLWALGFLLFRVVCYLRLFWRLGVLFALSSSLSAVSV